MRFQRRKIDISRYENICAGKSDANHPQTGVDGVVKSSVWFSLWNMSRSDLETDESSLDPYPVKENLTKSAREISCAGKSHTASLPIR